MSRDIDVHPHDHALDELERTDWDVIVIGAGSSGENVAGRAAAGGLSVVIVEQELVGGECSYWACTPSKSLLRPGEAIRAASVVDGARQALTADLDATAVLRRRDRNVHDYDDSGQVEWLGSADVALVRGDARLTGVRVVEVVGSHGGSVQLTARYAVAVCVGSGAALPPVDGLSDVRPWTAREATSATDVPRRLLVIGGGVVGCELATAYDSLGATVTLVEVGDRLLANNEPEAGRRVAASLVERGVDVRTGVTISSVRRDGTEVVATLDDGEQLSADEVLVAAGREPRTRDVGLESVGLKPGVYLEVDDQMTVQGIDGEWLYATGDCNGRALLTHQGKYQARVCGDVIVARAKGGLDASKWSKHSATADHRAVPQVAFTDPQVAAVGLTVQKAREAGLRVRSVEYAIGDVAGAGEYADDYDGWACMVVDEDRRVVVGVTLVGAAVGELIHAATVAVVGEVPLERLWHAVPSYPTISEIWLRLLEEYGL